MLKHLISDASQSVARALRKGSQLLGTLAYLLHPEGGYEGSQTHSRGSDPPEEDDSPSFPVGDEFAIPPDAEQMIAKPLHPPPRMPDAPLAGSIKDRMKQHTAAALETARALVPDAEFSSWAEQYRRLRAKYEQTTLEGFPDRHGRLQDHPFPGPTPNHPVRKVTMPDSGLDPLRRATRRT